MRIVLGAEGCVDICNVNTGQVHVRRPDTAHSCHGLQHRQMHMCIDMGTGMHVNMCGDAWMNMCDLCTGMCTDIRMGICVGAYMRADIYSDRHNVCE